MPERRLASSFSAVQVRSAVTDRSDSDTLSGVIVGIGIDVVDVARFAETSRTHPCDAGAGIHTG